ncbi:hypothetical protein DUNSADRAFT_3834 [Dunaliella salina]|uniref:Dimethylargininase n=1 Tax=Dunaliella salina TaxID=3046 RepID=A0ABQ7GT74_DUNSA|nr:hypothetical protein DUNSADRAFT_3834 [Dunaliella salina]|eukprot:KAF5837818.1 hypothetical protein DUNSADRAFT_3834 [Dunaliella salina]
MLDETTLLCADNAAGRSIQAQAETKPGLAGRFTFVGVPDPICCNVLRIGRTVVMQKGYPKSEEVIGPLCKSKGLSLNAVRMGECAKADGALTCCSVLLHVPKQK